MGGGDLNQKKSWHTQKATNVLATRRAEEATIAERKLAAQRQEEIRLERKQKEIQDALEAAGGTKRLDRVEWMYQDPTADGQAGAAENEAYLLGKRRIDKLLQDNETKKQASFVESLAGAAPPLVANAQDTAAKIRQDPLMAIKRQEQEAYNAIINDPAKRKQLLASLGLEGTAGPNDKDRGDRRHRHRHHHRRHHRDRDEDRSDDERRSRKRARRSDARDRSTRPRR